MIRFQKKISPWLGLEPTKMISFLQCIIFERISYSEFPLVVFLYLFLQKIYFEWKPWNGQHVCKKRVFFQVEIKKNYC